MRLHEIFFWLACFFLVGVLAASLASGFAHAYLIVILEICILLTLLILIGKNKLVILGIFMMVGAGYYLVFDYHQKDVEIVFDKRMEFEGIVLESEQRLNSQKLIVDADGALLQLSSQRYPVFKYGDKISIDGVIKEPFEDAANYFAKEGIGGLVSFPKLTLISKNNGSSIKTALFKIKDFFQASYRKVLPFDQAAFMSGLTLGSTAEFSDEFKEDMKKTGTTHLVALSGYNISIIVDTLGALLAGWVLTRKLKLPLAILLVVGFVVMTGAEPSVVRAAIMAGVFMLAGVLKREYYIKNSIMAAAGIMVVANPKVLVFDVGFQLSFLALLGIIYLQPLLKNRWPRLNQPSFINWRRNLLTTTSAQLAVLPLLIYYFGYVSPWGIVTNVLLLEFIPVTMALGFFICLAALVWWPLAWLISWPTTIFLTYELGVINFFANLSNHVF